MILVSVILFLFLGNIRGAIIVAADDSVLLLFAAICLDLKHIPANLLSLGALDFGMVVEGAMVMIENIVRHLTFKRRHRDPTERIGFASHEVQRPVFYAIGIIITAYLPIFTLQRVEGRLFQPMAWTVAFALLGALIFSMLIAPVLASFAFAKGAKEWHNPVMSFSLKATGTRFAGRFAIASLQLASSDSLFWSELFLLSVVLSGPNFYPISMKALFGSAELSLPAPGPTRESESRTKRASSSARSPKFRNAQVRSAAPMTARIPQAFSILSILST